MKIRSILIIALFLLVLSLPGYYLYKKFYLYNPDRAPLNPQNIASNSDGTNKELVNPDEKVEINIPRKKIPENNYHTFQTFNNCGPASLSMALSYYGISVSQKVLGDELRPYQIASGDNDDKSVTLYELAEKSKDYGLIPFHRPMGNPEIVKKFISINIPVITRTWTKPNEDIGHYRVIKGFDEDLGVFVQDDSLQGKNLKYKYTDFNDIWDKFSFEFLVLIPAEKVNTAKEILGDLADEDKAWKQAVKFEEDWLREKPSDANMRLNYSVALYKTGQAYRSIEEFEKAEASLPKRALWYQIEPIKAYFDLGNYDRVFEITDKILEHGNRAYSEVYILRGDIFKTQVKLTEAKSQYEKAVLYNKNLTEAKEKLEELNAL